MVREAANPRTRNRRTTFTPAVDKELDKLDKHKTATTVESHPNKFKNQKFKAEDYPQKDQADIHKRTRSKTNYKSSSQGTRSKDRNPI